MPTSVDQWDIHPDHFWLTGKRPDQLVEYNEELEMWMVYGYPEAIEVLTQPKLFSNDGWRLVNVEVEEWVKEGDFAQMDPPQHRKLRGLVDFAFTPKLVANLQPRVDEVVHELIDELEHRDSFDMVADFANPLPVAVISDMLGVPKSDRDLFKGWMHGLLDDAGELDSPDDIRDQEATMDDQFGLLREMRDYWAEQAAERRRQPREDLLSHLVHAEFEGERLSDGAVFNIANRMLINGHHTTELLIGNTVLCLTEFPEQAARVRADRSLVPALIEESLRFLSPLAGVMRVSTTEVEVAGQLIPKDQMVMAWCGAANRDGRVFTDPDTFDAARSPNAHLGFGRGVHFCMGRRLARLEAKSATNILLDRLPKLRTDPADPPKFGHVVDATGVARLPVLNG